MKIIILLVLFISGCSTIPSPERKPLTYGIISEDFPQSTQRKIQVGTNKNLAIILSENTKNSIKYLKKTQDEMLKESKNTFNKLGGVSETYKANFEAHNPQIITNSIIKTLKKYYGKVVLVNNLATLDKNTYKNFAIIDIFRGYKIDAYSYLGSGAEESSEIKTAFYDSLDNTHLNTASGMVTERTTDGSEAIYLITEKSLTLWKLDLERIIE